MRKDSRVRGPLPAIEEDSSEGIEDEKEDEVERVYRPSFVARAIFDSRPEAAYAEQVPEVHQLANEQPAMVREPEQSALLDRDPSHASDHVNGAAALAQVHDGRVLVDQDVANPDQRSSDSCPPLETAVQQMANDEQVMLIDQQIQGQEEVVEERDGVPQDLAEVPALNAQPQPIVVAQVG